MKDDNKKTSWGKVAEWYSDLLEKESGTYQKDLILPNLIRLMEIKTFRKTSSIELGRGQGKQGETILDLACGQGFFSREFLKAGAKVIGVDISRELIRLARELTKKELPDAKADFVVSSADDLSFIKDKSIDKIVIVLAIQNIENVSGVFKECSRVLKPSGKLFLVMNHPAFRIPKQSDWGWDDKEKIQYRRVNEYLSESKVRIQMHPGENPDEKTISFHRPIQYYFKLLSKNGFAVSRLEEWNSNRKSQPGPRSKAEDKARKEIPLFMFMEAIKIN
jgi:ubiquinone/menaquinone biosynthesis C-methylase UbiE